MLGQKSVIPFGIIGLGLFGSALAENLADSGKDVMVLDSDPNKIKKIQNKVANALVVPQIDRETLEESGIQNCATVIVCIGERIEVSLMAALYVCEMGVPRVIAKAINADHGKLLQQMGVEVVYPEKDMATRLADRLLSSRALDYIELSGEVSIVEMKLTPRFDGQTIMDIGFRKKYHLNVIAVIRSGETIVEIPPDMTLMQKDCIVVVGKNESIRAFERMLTQG